MDTSFWSGQKVFLTGHTGFKGAWLSLWLQSLGAEVTGYALAPEAESLFRLAHVERGMRSVVSDIRDAETLCREMQAAAPAVVIHMAAQALVRYSYAQPLETYAVNVMGTANLLEAVRRTPSVRAVVNVTTDKCYRNNEWEWGYRETDALGGHDPYSSSKACAELVTAAYRSSFLQGGGADGRCVPVATARAGNVIGGGDWARDRLIPDILAALTRGLPVSIRHPDAIRPWQHVLEPLAGYLTLAEALASTDGGTFADAWNFGPGDEDARPVRWIVEQMVARWGQAASWRVDDAPQPHEATYLKLDCSKARNRLRWAPRWSLSDALGRIVNWQRAHLRGEDMRAFTLGQVEAYMKPGQG